MTQPDCLDSTIHRIYNLIPLLLTQMRQTEDGLSQFDFNNRDFFLEILSEFDVSRDEVCIIGSVVLSYFDVRENRDIDFVCTYDARERIHEQIRTQDKPYEIGSNGGVKFGDDRVGLTRKDRFDMFGLSDDEVVKDSRYHFVVDGFKLLRPELELSIKRHRGNEKDKQDIKRIEEHLVGNEEWDWDLVHVVPPWHGGERDLVSEAIDVLRYEGPVRLLGGGIDHLWTNIVQDRIPTKQRVLEATPFYEVHQYRGTTETVDLTKLLSHQFNEDGQFVREDIVPAVLALEGDLEFDDGHTDETNRDDVVLSRDGDVLDGVWAIASILEQATDGGRRPRPKDLSVNASVSSAEDLPERTWEWVNSRFTDEEQAIIRQRRRELFESMGLVFYAFLWPAAKNHFDELEGRLAEVGQNLVTTEYESLSGFDEMVMDIYTADKRTDDWRIQKKIHELNKYEPVFRVVSFELPNPDFIPNETPRISSKTRSLKYACRKDLEGELDEYVFDIILHVTDNYRQNVHVTKVLDTIEDGTYTGLNDTA